MSILSKFKLDSSLFSAIADNIDALEPTTSTRTLTVGKTIDFKGTINGVEVPAQATLREASLTRLSILDQTSPYTGKQYYLVTGVMNPVQMDVSVTVEGEKIGLIDLLHKFVNESGQDLTKQASSMQSKHSRLQVQSMLLVALTTLVALLLHISTRLAFH